MYESKWCINLFYYNLKGVGKEWDDGDDIYIYMRFIS